MSSIETEINNLLTFLPKYTEIVELIKSNNAATYIFRVATDNIIKIIENNNLIATAETEEIGFLVGSLVHRFWEEIHTGYYCQVTLETRQIYTLACFFQICYLLLDSSCAAQIAKCNKIMDEALLLGCAKSFQQISEPLALFFKNHNPVTLEIPLMKLMPLERESYACDIPQLDCPTIEYFNSKHFMPQLPALLLNTMQHWPALEKWRDLNYIHKVAGNRSVPIEIGQNYTSDEWSQKLCKFSDFLQRQFAANKTELPTTIAKTTSATNNAVEYLAQHELFEQIPELRADICIPDYCMATGKHTTSDGKDEDVDIKAWLGPKGTISPMHHDKKHNLLCQVFGAKQILLATPADTPNLYAHETEFLINTTQIDIDDIDYEQFPLVRNVKFLNVTLQEGDCLYIPPKWWHYVKSKSESFSVSFWWE